MPFSTVKQFEKSFPSVKSLSPEQKQKALDIFNAMMKKPEADESVAIATAIKKSKMMSEMCPECDMATNECACKKEMSEIHYIQMLSDTRSVIEVLRVGTVYDRGLKITEKMLADFCQNFIDGVYGTEVQVNLGHHREGEAAGWIKRLFVQEESLMAEVEWTPLGVEKITSKQYRFTSSEFSLSYPHYQTGKKVENVFIGCALTNIPAMKGMAPVQLHETYNRFINNLKTMDVLKEMFTLLSAKDVISKAEFDEFKELAETEGVDADASAEMVGELEPKVEAEKEEKKEAPEETEEEKTAREAKEKEEAEKAEAEKLAAEEEAKKLAEQGKDMVSLSQAELNQLREAAEKATKLEEQVRITELKEIVKSDMCLSAKSEIGFKDDAETINQVATFMASLSQEQVEEFKQILSSIQTVDLSIRGMNPKPENKNAQLSEEQKLAKANDEAQKLHEESGKELHVCREEMMTKYGLL